jgi:uncharacterized damage-inducible protein DinB
MLLSYAAAILDRDLRTLQREVEAYPAEGDLWAEVGGVPNVGGTLALHLAGNIQYYVGAVLGRNGYVRDRPAEFARRHVPRTELVREIQAAREAVSRALSAAPDTKADFPELIAGKHVTTGEYLMHLTTHFAYHLGQLDYHRRVVTGKQDGVGAVQPAELSSAR